jgi:DNA polymerase (family 10)
MSDSSTIPLGRAHILASAMRRELSEAGVDSDVVTAVGRLRRFAPELYEVSLLATLPVPEQPRLLDSFARLPSSRRVVSRGTTWVAVMTDRGRVTLHVAEREVAGAALVWLTGSRAHVQQLAGLGARDGLRFSDARLFDADNRPVDTESEEALYARLALPYIAPELREGEDEIQAALEGRLPKLVTELHIRGDLHMHTTWSDGRDSSDQMVRASTALGYEYIAITDHSERAWSSRKLAVEDIPRQRAEIEEVRSRYPRIHVLHGIEVDIMRDGRLDFDDAVLAGFDIVLASLHDHGGQSGPELMERYLSAIHNPFVDVITHPAGRSPGQWSGYDLDFERLFAAAVETGTAMEIDGAPGHLDMDGAVARRAAAAGVTIVIDSDSHRAEWLRRQMRFGVGTARRGWLEPRHVLNARPVQEVKAFVARKRARARRR